jgi:hypothetical protein
MPEWIEREPQKNNFAKSGVAAYYLQKGEIANESQKI